MTAPSSVENQEFIDCWNEILTPARLPADATRSRAELRPRSVLLGRRRGRPADAGARGVCASRALRAARRGHVRRAHAGRSAGRPNPGGPFRADHSRGRRGRATPLAGDPRHDGELAGAHPPRAGRSGSAIASGQKATEPRWFVEISDAAGVGERSRALDSKRMRANRVKARCSAENSPSM
jgi:hypothetical protein